VFCCAHVTKVSEVVLCFYCKSLLNAKVLFIGFIGPGGYIL
jgi:hypothetical protein